MSDTGIMRQDEYFEVLDAVKNHIITAQKTVMNAANEERNRLYWRIGKTITEHSTWGNKFVQTLSKDLRNQLEIHNFFDQPNTKHRRIRVVCGTDP